MKWKEIKDYDGRYFVSDTGLVKNKKGLIMKPQAQNSGYYLIHLCKENKRKAFLVHRLVAEAFLGFKDSMQVDHIDFNKLNNNLSNLQWVSAKENNRKNWHEGQMEKVRERARIHMSELGTKNKVANGNRLRELNKALRKPIARLGSCGKIIQTFHSAKEAERLGFRNVRKVLSGKQKLCLGSRFIYITPNEQTTLNL